jgi:gamma-D-glutamyl-L-lysine dipeptidyl-peptidase
MIDRTVSGTGVGSSAERRMAGRVMRVTSPVAPLLAEPRASAPLTSQYLGGRRVEVLEDRGDWGQVRGADEYVGWMHAGYLAEAGGDRGIDDQRVSLGCIVRSASGRRRALPLAALLDDRDELVDGDFVPAADLSSHFPPEGSAIAGSAIRFFEGTSYLWGGVTPWGADCSGLVQTIYALHGTPMPRDAGDQGRCGIEVSPAPESLVAGDLLFFSDREDGRITHVAIAMGHARIVHLALGRGGYAVETLRGETDPYGTALRTRIRFARRVLGGSAG